MSTRAAPKNHIKKPAFSHDAVSETSLASGQIDKNAKYFQLSIGGDNYSGQRAFNVVLDECSFRLTNLSGTQFSRFQAGDVIFDGCDLANAAWEEAAWTRVELLGCRLLGFKSNEADLQDVTFSDCNVSLAQFRFARCKAVRFENCDLQNADFYQADLRCTTFSAARLQKANFLGSNLEGVQLGRDDLPNLKGALVDPFQAACLAGLMGLNVLSPARLSMPLRPSWPTHVVAA